MAKRRMFSNLQTHSEKSEISEPDSTPGASGSGRFLAGIAIVAGPRRLGTNQADDQARGHRERMRTGSEVQPPQNLDGHSRSDQQRPATSSAQIRRTLAPGPRRASPTNQRQSQPCVAAPQAAQAAKAAKTPQALCRPKV